MSTPFIRAPHQEGAVRVGSHAAPNAALLIDFDNVTMGMRSDLSKELKTLLNSDIIKGKVAVQRAYADWRRYPQYIVPLSEASIDLIFAPAYGSNKKNATDIRMAIDGMELVFIRPEIGTFILLTGDSDFSSLVLKLKEYGKYVIGVGIQESSSDILVQNCDEYYSYTSLAGLRKTTDADTEPVDPWLLVEKAVERMEKRDDVMRSDRLKQVMLEIDAGFDESEYGFSKFSKFVTEASSRGLIELKKLENGQYEVRPGHKGGGGGRSSGGSRSHGDRERREHTGSQRSGRGRSTRPRRGSDRSEGTHEKKKEEPHEASRASSGEPLQEAYDLLTSAVEKLTKERDVPAVRDSDVKRKMLDRDRSFDEAELGFSKFSLFLQQADEHGVIELRQRESGNYEVGLPGAAEPSSGTAGAPEPPEPPAEETEPEQEEEAASEKPAERGEETAAAGSKAGAEEERESVRSEESHEHAAASGREGRRATGGLGIRGGERPNRRKSGSGGPPILEGQMVPGSSIGSGGGDGGPKPHGHEGAKSEASTAPGTVVDPEDLGLPTDRTSVIRYLTNSYRGVGEKTAETLVDELGTDVFEVLQREPSRIRDVVPPNRAEQLLDAWEEDFRRRRQRAGSGSSEETGRLDREAPGSASAEGEEPAEEEQGSGLLGRRGRRTRR